MARKAIDEAMANILLPQKEKEKLVEQLQENSSNPERYFSHKTKFLDHVLVPPLNLAGPIIL